MTTKPLEIIASAMADLQIEYGFARYYGMDYPYFVGEYIESEPLNEDGLQEASLTLTGFTRGTWAELEEAKGKIEEYFSPISGNTQFTADGSAVTILYASSYVIPKEDADLKSIQINMKIMEWRVA